MFTLTIPAFFVFDHSGSNPDWQRIEQAGASISMVVPESSIGLGALDATVIQRYREQFQHCRTNGQKILGYVSTRSGTRSRTEIDGDIQSWFNRYSAQLDGIFFDEGPMFDNSTQQFYTTLINDFKTSHPVNNTVLLNAAQFPNEWVMHVADYVILWEEKQSAYLNQYTAIGPGGSVVGVPAWWTNPQYTNRIVHVVWNCPTAAEMRNLVVLSQSRRAGNVYVYDGNSSAYNHLPAYWQEELTAVGTVLWVASLYRDLLQRRYDDEGLEHWVRRCFDGISAAEVSGAFCYSEEYSTTLVTELYSWLLDRAPDDEGLGYWRNALTAGMSRQAAIIGFLTSEEYLSRNPVPQAFVASLYRRLLRREPDPNGFEFWVHRLNSGATVDDVAHGFLISDEFCRNYVSSLYSQYLRRAPEETGWAWWTAKLQEGLAHQDAIAGFLSSDEYQNAVRNWW